MWQGITPRRWQRQAHPPGMDVAMTPMPPRLALEDLWI